MFSFTRSLSLRHLLSGAAVALLTSVAMVLHADLITYTYTGATIAIPDNVAAGVNLDITVPTAPGTNFLQEFQSVSLTMSNAPAHTYVGDLIATLTHVPSGTSIDLFRRVGKSSTTTGFGDPAEFGGTFTFSNILTPTGEERLIDAALPVLVVPTGTYRPTTNTFNGDNTDFTGETITDLNATFDGLADTSGIWRLNISDNSGEDTGSIVGYRFTVNAVPAPSSVAIMALGGLMPLVAIARRRRAAK